MFARKPSGHPPAPSRAPARIAQYEVLGVLGHGAMGIVYHAYDMALSKDVAIKVMREPFVDSTVLHQRFAAEVAVVNQIGHPNIVNIFGFARLPDGRPYYVMEFLRGVSLYDRLEEVSTLRSDQIIDWMRSVADAIGAGHAKRIVHRDLKPDNIFLVDCGQGRDMVKVLDFGVAKLLEGPAMTLTGMRIGTPLFMSPEQFCGGAIDHRADIYAFGAIYYRALTGRGHCPQTSLRELSSFHRFGDPPPRPSFYGVAPGLDDPILRCLARSPADRFDSILQAQQAIEDAIAAATTLSSTASEPTRSIEIASDPPSEETGIYPRVRRPMPKTTPAMRFSNVARYRAVSSRRPVVAALMGAAMLVVLLIAALLPSGPDGAAGPEARADAATASAAEAQPAPDEPAGLAIGKENTPASLVGKDIDPDEIKKALLSNGALTRCMRMAAGREIPQLLGAGFDADGNPTMRLRGGDPELRRCIKKAFEQVARTVLATAS